MNLFTHLLVPPCILISCFISAVPQVAAKAQGGGRVNMQGAIIDTACAIAAGSREQTIDMDAVPVGNIARDGQGNTRPFTIELTNCTLERPTPNLPDWKQFQVTFDGDVDGDLFGVSGEAKGVGLKIIDSQGNVAIPGSPLPFNEIITTRMLLNYTIKLVSNNKPLHAGRYFSSVRFKLDYY